MNTDEHLRGIGARVFGLVVVAVMGAAFYWTVRVEVSDWVYRQWSPGSVRRAVALAPLNPEYYRGWAEIEPGRAVASLEKAVELSPASAILWIQLGQAAEEKGDFGLAESSLRHALELDRKFAPRWALAEFYLHRGEAEKFWPVEKAALEMSYDDVSELFRNCWKLSQDSGEILAKAIPDRPAVLQQYLAFLIREGRSGAAAPVAERLLKGAETEDREALLNYVDSLLAGGQGAQALSAWNGLTDRKVLPYGRLRPEVGESLTNGDFRVPHYNAGFDWRFLPPEGVYVYRVGNPATVFVSFSGKQPEDCEILSQYMPVMPGRQYELTVRYRTTDIASDTGPMCRVLRGDGTDLLRGAGLLPGGAEGDTAREMRFATPADTGLVRLVFGYQRTRGTVRIEGSVVLKEFSLRLDAKGGQ